MSLFQNTKKRFLKKKSNPLNERSVVLKKPDQFLHILAVFNNENEAILKTISTNFRNAQISALFNRSSKEDTTTPLRYSVHESDFNLTGKLKNDKLLKLTQCKFDLIIDLSNDSEFLNFFVQTISSTLKIGKMGNSKENLYDLFLEFGTSEETFLGNITKQLNHLKNDK